MDPISRIPTATEVGRKGARGTTATAVLHRLVYRDADVPRGLNSSSLPVGDIVRDRLRLSIRTPNARQRVAAFSVGLLSENSK